MKTKTITVSALILFSTYVLYQILRKLLGGSWSIEEIILALVVVNLGWTGYLQKEFSQHVGEQKLSDHRLKSIEDKLEKVIDGLGRVVRV
ncbi:MAG: hypothetical protein AABX39_06770 [Nanoarchaeota archaeon]